MSSNGTRKETRGWEISSTGQMINVSTDDVAIEELPPSGPIVIGAGGTAPPVPHAPPAAPRQPARDSDAMAMLDRPRGRKSTLDSFNDELAVLDRPLDGDVEYVDEPPRRSRMRGAALFAGVVLGMGLGGGAIVSRRHAAAPPSAEAAPPAVVAAATAATPPTAAPTVLAAQVEPKPALEAPAAEAADPAAEEDDSAKDDGTGPAVPGSHAAWDKVKAKSGHEKPSRGASGKSSHHRGGSKRTASAKHASARHH
jgi:hypothetical protein